VTLSRETQTACQQLCCVLRYNGIVRIAHNCCSTLLVSKQPFELTQKHLLAECKTHWK